MTIEEKKEAIKKYCNDRNYCKDCVFAPYEVVCCLYDEDFYSNISDKRIDELYNILVYNIKGGIDLPIQEKREIVKNFCKTKEYCSQCSLCHINKNCWYIANNGSDKESEEIYNILTYGKVDITRNIADFSDSFICEKCGLHLEHIKVVYDVFSEYSEYKFNYCPSCGRWVVEK